MSQGNGRLHVVEMPRDLLTPYSRNPRKKNQRAVDKVAASIRAFGWRQPIVVDEHFVVIAGHTRLAAAESLGLDLVPVHVAEGLSPEQAAAYRLADNRTNEEAEWEMELLSEELIELSGLGIDLDPIGFDPSELNKLLTPDFRGDEEDIPAPPAEPFSERGAVYNLGPHRLMCGDATDPDDVRKLLGGAEPHLMVTDPPYGVEYDPNWRNEAAEAGHLAKGDRAIGQVSGDDRADWTEAWKLFPGDVIYVWHAGQRASEVQTSIERAGFEIRSQIVWAKSRHVISRGHYHGQHEPCWYAVRKGKAGHWNGSRTETTLWEIHHPKSDTGHGTQKPLEAMRRPILNNSVKGDRVYDPFGGSGTTLIAAEETGRVCYMMEIDPGYCDVIQTRYERFKAGT